MKLFLLLTFCVASSLAVPAIQHQPIPLEDVLASLNRHDRIIHGNPAELGQIPWQVAIIFSTPQGSFFCGGSLISPQWVLTAAHCAQGALDFTILLGDISLSGNSPSRLVDVTTTAVVHPGYNPANLNNDIALVQLSGSVAFNENIQPIGLPQAGNVIGVGEVLKVSGWGLTSDQATSVSDILYYTRVNSISNQQCADVFGTAVVVDSTICTLGNPLNSTCSGDSGGPLIVENADGSVTHVGVVSFGAAAGCELGFPAGFARTESFLAWILATTGL